MEQSARATTWIDWVLVTWASIVLGGLALASETSWLPGEIIGSAVTAAAVGILILYRRARAARYPQIELAALMKNPFGLPESWEFWITAGTFGILPAAAVIIGWTFIHHQPAAGAVSSAGYAAALASYWYYRRGAARSSAAEAELTAREDELRARLRRRLGEPD